LFKEKRVSFEIKESKERVMDEAQLVFDLQQIRPTACSATVTVPAQWVGALYNHASRKQQKNTNAYGFHQGEVPLDYIQQNFKSTLLEHIKEFLFNYCVVSFLYKELMKQKVLFSGEPRLSSISIQPHCNAHFSFELNTFPPFEIQDWKYLPFKSPKRKKYKDLDRQVEDFVKEEKELLKKNLAPEITSGDWVNFSITLLDDQETPVLKEISEIVWLKLGHEEIDKELASIFIGKKIGETFCSDNKEFQCFFSELLQTDYSFSIHILDIQPMNYFCLEQFKNCFKIKTNKDVYKKMIEVFSYSNDMSQRRITAEESLKLLLSKHQFIVPNHLALRQQARIINSIKSNPDYHVYRTQTDFKKRIRQLAERQTKECLLLDRLAHHENIMPTDNDVRFYLNLVKRPRMREFLYFDPIPTKINGQEMPISNESLKFTCLREKTLNYIIYHLTKE
jgi:trigger factor